MDDREECFTSYEFCPYTLFICPSQKPQDWVLLSEDLKWYSYSHFIDGETETQ